MTSLHKVNERGTIMHNHDLKKQNESYFSIDGVDSTLIEFVQIILSVQDKLNITKEALSIIERRAENNNDPESLLFKTVFQYLGEIYSDLENLGDVMMDYSKIVVQDQR